MASPPSPPRSEIGLVNKSQPSQPRQDSTSSAPSDNATSARFPQPSLPFMSSSPIPPLSVNDDTRDLESTQSQSLLPRSQSSSSDPNSSSIGGGGGGGGGYLPSPTDAVPRHRDNSYMDPNNPLGLLASWLNFAVVAAGPAIEWMTAQGSAFMHTAYGKIQTAEFNPETIRASVEGMSTELLVSVVLNVFFFVALLISLLTGGSKDCHRIDAFQMEEAWALPAVEAALAAANYPCSGHGDVWIDSPQPGKNAPSHSVACECWPCYSGHECQHLQENCSISLTSGNPLLFEDYWKANAASGTLLIPSAYRVGFENNGNAFSHWQSEALENSIRQLHLLVGNVVSHDERYLVIGNGAQQLIQAALFAFADREFTHLTGNPVLVTSAPPYLKTYNLATHFYDSQLFSWGGNPTNPDFSHYPRVIEFVTSPNDPDGHMDTSAFNKSRPSGTMAPEQVSCIYDFSYYWPHFTPITYEADHDVMIFDLSMLTGHAGSRIGWAVVKNKAVFQRFLTAIDTMSLGVSHESQLRALTLIDSIIIGLESNHEVPPAPTGVGESEIQLFAADRQLFSYAAAIMQDRWQRLLDIFSEGEGGRKGSRCKRATLHLSAVFSKKFGWRLQRTYGSTVTF
eukprot:TRINITY_DN22173_c0_g1_i1.p1 TRINITY_DN22173_c0_g1~~TRINITY_DN22173_c0_g1_i1.p1  ORF type:complete len:624 (+),score=63.73 TRINITY_DN22173_c0_g1_i1:718-2589(+)